ncbi:lactonase family protein [Streptomyces sp. ME19-01-6]|uniref:lactonase family protein n=1 Tax=Streptomyces sp. ME19-01-6 TaxID=3028686 RepID=UPI0029A3FBCC|nr:lactonase family protein [Streptomyces sp. ME19-01-6]MDX3230515.1 lactonase family protein [Streptomyces sp. ME19-01-6]
MSTTGSGQRAYIGSFTSAGGDGVTVASVDAETGALSVLHTTDAVPNPSYLALAPGGEVLYAVSETDDGAAAALRVADPTRPPAPLGAPVPVRGAVPTHLALAAGHLLTANYGSGSVTALPVQDDGALAEPSAVLRHEGSGPDAARQEGPHAHAVVPDPSGRWVLAVDLGTDSVWVYAAGMGRGAGGDATLRLHREVRLRPGSGPRHLAFHPRGERAYVVNELDSTVTVCRWDPASGTLDALGEVRVLPSGTDVPNFPSEIVVSADGRFVWVANRGHDSVATLTLDAPGDTMTLATTTPCGGHWPRDLTLAPSGRHLYAANERSGDVTWFRIDPSSGVPARVGSLDAPAASCVIFA